ncbi:methylmalonyl Co-A mutase-associated GTPase MeaB [Candidatus Riflebacteria bacterium]
MAEDKRKPEWAEDGANNEEFTTSVVKGVESSRVDDEPGDPGLDKKKCKRVKLNPENYIQGVLKGDRTILARCITLIESNARQHLNCAQKVLKKLLPHTGKSLRIGITGIPGAGKSSFIDCLGSMLCQDGLKPAVLAIDPSSNITGGSIMGDKTRMERLHQKKDCFIRPSPTGGALGGVARKTRETILVCEASGFNVILVETVGVGQSEVLVRSMVDFFLLITITGAGDELQNIKKGVMENADAILINKADGDNILSSNRLKKDLNQVLHFLNSPSPFWKTGAFTCSSLKNEGIKEIWEEILQFEKLSKKSGFFYERRKKQAIDWMYSMVFEQLKSRFYDNARVASALPGIEKQIYNGKLPPTSAAQKLLDILDMNMG